MAIRLYYDGPLSEGKSIALSPLEMRYFKSVRHGRGEVCLFNCQGLEAFGVWSEDGKHFKIDRIHRIESPLHPIELLVAMPEQTIVASIIRSVSELGVSRLTFFRGDRSQAPKARLNSQKNLERWNRIAIESMRQCARGRPLEIKNSEDDLFRLLKSRNGPFLFFDEAPDSSIAGFLKTQSQEIFAIVGCEGGWTDREREVANEWREKEWLHFVHLPTPILRAETAVTCAALWSVLSAPLSTGGSASANWGPSGGPLLKPRTAD